MLLQVVQMGSSGSSALIGLVGGLSAVAGALVGSFTTWRIQKSQQSHADRTRFHDQRLEIYARFNGAVRMMVGWRAVAAANATKAPHDIADVSQRMLDAFESLVLVASADVGRAATALHADATKMLSWPVPNFDEVTLNTPKL